VQGRIATHHGDMRSFTLEQQYALVIIPFRAFLHNITREDQLATLRRVHTHLRQRGRIHGCPALARNEKPGRRRIHRLFEANTL